jgi:hypothetical protein
MKKHRIFNKGEQIHCFLTSYSDSNVFIPIKALVMDTQWDPVNPKYLVKILKFYDSFDFLKRHFFDLNFFFEFEKRAHNIPLKSSDFKKITDLEIRLNQTDEKRFYVVVESVMAVKQKLDLQQLFNDIQFFLICRKLSEAKELMTRPFYKGSFRLDSQSEFNIRMKNAFSDKFKNGEISIDRLFDSL